MPGLVPPPRRVCVVGAGVSGVATSAHLLAAGLEVMVFERLSVAGGVWVYDKRVAPEPKYPSVLPSQAEKTWEDLGGDETAEILNHAPPGPCYAGLMNNVSTPLMRLKLNRWKTGTEDYVSHEVLEEYIQDTALKTGVHDITVYNTRVEHATKKDGKWHVSTSTLSPSKGASKILREWEFDAFVVASGHYHAGRVPDIPGLSSWKSKWPSRIHHSKSYRDPEQYRGQNVLLIGAGTSSTDIARELASVAQNVYQVSRGGVFDIPLTLLPETVERVPEIIAFEASSLDKVQSLLGDYEPLPGPVLLKDGRRIENIHRIIACTGYQFCLPFLLKYHDDDTPVHKADDTVLVTDGTQVHNLHKDIFYIRDPTLAFIGIPFYSATFSLFEIQAQALAAVFSGKAWLPSEAEMGEQYQLRVEKKGVGRSFHSLREAGAEVAYGKDLVDWLNRDGEAQELELVEGHTEEWHAANVDRLGKLKARLETFQRNKGRDALRAS